VKQEPTEVPHERHGRNPRPSGRGGRQALFPVDPQKAGLEAVRPLVTIKRERGRDFEGAVAAYVQPDGAGPKPDLSWCVVLRDRRGNRVDHRTGGSLIRAVSILNRHLRQRQATDQRRLYGRSEGPFVQLEHEAVLEHLEVLAADLPANARQAGSQ